MPLTNAESAQLVETVNNYPLGFDKIIPSFSSVNMGKLLQTKCPNQTEITGPLLYPCSGADVVYPIGMFPVNEFVLVDYKPLFESDITTTHKDLLNFGKTHITNSVGMFGQGFDRSDLISMLKRSDQKLKVTSQSIGAILLLRLRKLCGMELTSIHEQVPGQVYTIIGVIQGTQKTIHYVSHGFGEQTLAYAWLKEKAFEFQILFLKAFAPAINGNIIKVEVFSQIKSLIDSSLQSQNLAVISDAGNDYILNNYMPHLIDPKKVVTIPTSFDFGYSNTLVVGNFNAIYENYPSHLHEQLQFLEEKREQEEKLKMEHESQEKKRKADLLQMDNQELLKQLQADSFIEIKENTFVVHIDHENYQIISGRIANLLEESKKMHITSLLLVLKHDGDGARTTLHQETTSDIVRCLDKSGSHIDSLSIQVNPAEEVGYLSTYSMETATLLRMHGRNLSIINVMVNDRGALAFTETVQFLRENGKLNEVSIKPIKDWEHSTIKTVSQEKNLQEKNRKANLLQMDNQELLKQLQADSFIEIKESTFVVHIDHKNYQIISGRIANLLEESKKMHITSLLLVLKHDGPGTKLLYQETTSDIVRCLDKSGSHIDSLSIQVNPTEEVGYLSTYSMEAATLLRTHGRNLSIINVMVNDKGALAFTETVQFLRENGKLNEVSIKPIKNWKHSTIAIVSLTVPEQTVEHSSDYVSHGDLRQKFKMR